FLEMAALQCGICTSGMLVASDALLKKNPDPSEEEVRYWLAGNLCRCTGYDKIVRAGLETAAEKRGETLQEAAQGISSPTTSGSASAPFAPTASTRSRAARRLPPTPTCPA